MSTKNNGEYYNLDKYKDYSTGEQRAFFSKYTDPLTLNFKLLIDFDATTGLFAAEENVNSALAYLKRIGPQENERYEMLKHWIDVFKIFIQDYDFLILEIIGLEIIQNAKAFEQFIENEDSIEIKIRETSDMLIQGLISTYRHIWFDNRRGVEVLPINLRRFDINILVFSSGYFNMLFYDDSPEFKNEVKNDSINERLIFPTIKKLNDRTFKNVSSEKYNHILFSIQGCSINNEESGKSFIETLSNEMSSDYVKNTLVFNFKFAEYSGRFNNIMGDMDFLKLLTLMSAQNKVINTEKSTNNGGVLTRGKDGKMYRVKTEGGIHMSDIKNSLKNSVTDLKSSLLKTVKTKANNQLNKITSKNSVIGDILSKMTPQYATQMIKNTIDVGINKIETKYIDNPLARINNMLFQNFSNNLIDIYKNSIPTNSNIELIENTNTLNKVDQTNYVPASKNNVQKGITFGSENIYSRKGF